MNHEDTDPSDDLPVPEAPARNAPVARQPMEQVARAMQIQAELLKQMHERTRMLEDVVKDNRRHELVINSAQALNESFQGLQRVQERLADKLEDSGGIGRARFLVIALGLVALSAVGATLTWRIVEKADTLNSSIRTALNNPGQRDSEVQSDLAKLENRLQGIEQADRAANQDVIERLRKNLDAIGTERDTLRRERDSAREELGAAKATLTGAQAEVADVKGKSQVLEKENARLAAEALAGQKTLVQLNDVLAAMKDAKPAGTAPPKQPVTETDAPRRPVSPPDPVTAGDTAPQIPPQPRPAPAEPAAKTDAEPVSSAEPLAPLPAAQLAAVNELLKKHSGSDRYNIKRAEKVGQRKLHQVVMEVTGPDNVITKTIEAETLAFVMGDRLLDLEFEGGNVTFHQGLAGKSTKSPFFNNRYVIVVLGANGKDWLAADLPFVRAK
jgi:hypothetical protein